MHLQSLHHVQVARVKRQQMSAEGIALSTAVASGNSDEVPDSLVYDSKVSVTVPVTISFAAATPVFTHSPEPTPEPTTTEPAPSPSPSRVDAAGKSNTGTLVGACIGAFIGAALLLSFVLFWLKRQNRNAKAARQVRQARSASDARNLAGEAGRRRSRFEPWTKLEEGGDDDGDKTVRQDMTQRSPNEMENMTMFKKSPSLRSNLTQATSAEAAGANYFGVDPAMLSKYHNGLAEELATAGEAPTNQQQPRQFLGRLDTDHTPLSWSSETVGDESFLTLRSMRVSGTMSPTPGSVAKQTPPATAHGEHQWQSAVVVQPEEIENPFSDDGDNTPHRQASNPFFSAKDREGLPSDRKVNRSRSRSRSRRDAPKQAESADPFADVHAAKVRALAESGHRSTDSTSSDVPSERAMASLLAALDISPSDAQERLQLGRASVADTVTSSVAYDEDEQSAIRNFPLPPSSHESDRIA